mmetsp:Transcript_21656/g.50622  ORF Transcript_21656/g.50622 Transcript_21656/m.50622 type:complete len:341 (-) Transcript_21656:160-1182(-)|eukprot:CAMPEP_0178384124 /NCGR_PEP_ID=MMETSP0689_2-20121128/7355_1 /TAXON_ID=160604 /ORGANISM="Amphidinium massartii, Strain CS-259" /LENGTH=340 /DNA_ID=CAMNT_0020004365 /DNA_START=50 /DNA_END=1072 /DNA_ORIENTATION=-
MKVALRVFLCCSVFTHASGAAQHVSVQESVSNLTAAIEGASRLENASAASGLSFQLSPSPSTIARGLKQAHQGHVAASEENKDPASSRHASHDEKSLSSSSQTMIEPAGPGEPTSKSHQGGRLATAVNADGSTVPWAERGSSGIRRQIPVDAQEQGEAIEGDDGQQDLPADDVIIRRGTSQVQQVRSLPSMQTQEVELGERVTVEKHDHLNDWWQSHSTTTTTQSPVESTSAPASPHEFASAIRSFASNLLAQRRRLDANHMDNLVMSDNRFKGAQWMMLGLSVCVVLCLFAQKEIAKKELRVHQAKAEKNRWQHAQQVLAEAEAHALRSADPSTSQPMS